MEHFFTAYLISVYAKSFHLDRAELSCSLKLASGYSMVNKDEHYGIGKIDAKTIKAWDIDKGRLVYDVDYSIYWSAYYLDFVKQSYKETDFTTWQCSFVSKYTNRSAFCIDYMIDFRKCIDSKDYL